MASAFGYGRAPLLLPPLTRRGNRVDSSGRILPTFMSRSTTAVQSPPSQDWRYRLKALTNIPPILKMVWESAPAVVSSSLFCRFVAALVPLTMLAVTRVIIDSITGLTGHHIPLPGAFWWLVALEFGLATLAMILGRIIDFCDAVLADKFTCHINTRIMEHASSLDLLSYEDPLFHDKMERARVQGTDRIGMIQAIGRLVQEVITTVSLAASIFLFSPWILVVLIACIVPTFFGETHFAFLGYSLNSQQTPARREMEYVRNLGGSRESAKELKLFGLGPFLVDRYSRHFQRASPADSCTRRGAGWLWDCYSRSSEPLGITDRMHSPFIKP